MSIFARMNIFIYGCSVVVVEEMEEEKCSTHLESSVKEHFWVPVMSRIREREREREKGGHRSKITLMDVLSHAIFGHMPPLIHDKICDCLVDRK